MAYTALAWSSVTVYALLGSKQAPSFFRAAAILYGAQDVARFLVFLLRPSRLVPRYIIIYIICFADTDDHAANFYAPTSLKKLLWWLHFGTARYRRSHTANVRARYFRQLLWGVREPPRLSSYIPYNSRDAWSRWFMPIKVIVSELPSVERSERDFLWWCWRRGHCHTQQQVRRARQPYVFRGLSPNIRRLHTRRRQHMHGGSGGSTASPSEEVIVIRGDEPAASYPEPIPQGVLGRFVPDRNTSVTLALADHPPMSRAARPLYFDGECPVFVTDEPNSLLMPADDVDSARELARFHLDLVWASRHAVALRRQLADVTSQGFRALRVSSTLRLSLWVVPLLDQIQPVQELLRRWDEARTWLQHGGVSETEVQSIEEARALFNEIPWSARVPAGNPAVHLSTLELASFLSSRWLNDEMINAGLDWTIRRMAAQAATQGVPVSTGRASVYLLPSFTNARAMRPSYQPRMSSALDRGIQTGEITTFSVPANPGGNHWAAYHVSVTEWTYTYVDSLGGNANPRDVQLLNWYLREFRPGGRVPQPL